MVTTREAKPPAETAEQVLVSRLAALQPDQEGDGQVGAAEMLEALDNVDLSLPRPFILDIMADELLGYLQGFQAQGIALQAARRDGQHDKAERHRKEWTFTRLAAALIQSRYPGVKAVADEKARLRAQQAAQNRAKILGDGD